MRDVKISAVMNGFVVKVGCQTLVFQKQREMLEKLDQYLTNPEQIERQFIDHYGMKSSNDHDVVGAAPSELASIRQAPERSYLLDDRGGLRQCGG